MQAGDVLQQHILDLPLDVLGLVSHWHFRQTRKIDKGQGNDIRGEYAQVNGLW
jgi:hypothetical protein